MPKLKIVRSKTGGWDLVNASGKIVYHTNSLKDAQEDSQGLNKKEEEKEASSKMFS